MRRQARSFVVGVAATLALCGLFGSAAAGPRVALDQKLAVHITGNGHVSSSPKGIDCSGPDSCSENFKDKEVVTLSQSADSGWHFVGWDGDCSGAKDCKVVMDQKRSVDAKFAQNAPQCSDGIDNDGDGKIDLADPGCSDANDDSESPDPVLPQCSNGKDDDGDGKVDLADPGCSDAKDDSESPDPVIMPLPQCSDGKDNDGDGKIDLADPGCSAKDDNSESPDPGPPPSGRTVSRKFTFDGPRPGTKPKIPGVRFVTPVVTFVPKNTEPFSFPSAARPASCSSSLKMSFDDPLSSLSLRAGLDKRAAPKAGTYARLVGFDRAGQMVADSGDLQIARGREHGPITTQLEAMAKNSDMTSATLTVGTGTLGHNTRPECPAIDDLVTTVAERFLRLPSITITAPDDGTVYERTGDVRISGQVRTPEGLDTWCMTVGVVSTMPAGCSYATPFGDGLGTGGTFYRRTPGGLAAGRNLVTAWVRDSRGSVASDSVTVEVTGEPLVYDVVARAIEVTQAVQQFDLPGITRYVDPGLLSLYGVPGRFAVGDYVGVTMAANGRTIVRVYPQFLYSGRSSLSGVTVRLHGMSLPSIGIPVPLEGDPLLPISSPLSIAPSTDLTGTWLYAQRSDPRAGFTFELPFSWTRGGLIRLVAQVISPPATPRLHQTDTANDVLGVDRVPFQAMQNYYLAVVALDSTFNTNGRAPGVTGASACGGFSSDARGQLGTWFRFATAMLPLGQGQIFLGYAGCIDITGIHRCNDADVSAGRCSAARARARGNEGPTDGLLINALAGWTGSNPRARDSQVYGLSGSEPPNGMTSGGYATSATDGRPQSSVMHELGHALGLPHSGCPPPGADQGGVAWPPDNVGFIQGVGLDRGALPPPAGAPFRILAPNRSYAGQACPVDGGPNCQGTVMPQHSDWESYCGGGEDSDWISTRNWTALLNRLSVGASSPSHGSHARALARARGPGILVTAEVPAKLPARILGVRPGAVLSPPSLDSEFHLVVRNGAGRIVSDTRVEVAETAHHKADGVVTATVPGPGAAKVELLRGSTVLASRSRSAHAPKVGAVRVTAGARNGLVSWKQSDADHDPLEARVEYSANGGRSWQSIGLTWGTSMTLPARLFSASANARVRVVVNDGFRDTSAVSPRFRAPGAPPDAQIDWPVRKQTIASDALLELAGRGYDDAGHVLAGKSLRWLLGKRLLGVGTRVSVTGLPAGKQTIRLEVRDRLGRVGVATVQVVIRGVAPEFTVLAVPSKISRTARLIRVRVASALPGTLRVGTRTYAVNRKIRAIAIPVKPGRSPLVLDFRLTAAGKTAVRRVTIAR